MWDTILMLFIMRMNKKQTENFTISILGCTNKNVVQNIMLFIRKFISNCNSMDTHKNNLEMVTIGLIMGNL